MTYVYKRGRRWWIGYRDEAGALVRRSVPAATKTEAKRLADELERRAFRVRAGIEESAPAPTTLAEVAERFFATSTIRSLEHFQSRWRCHLKESLGEKLLTEITPDSISAFLKSKESELGDQSREHLRVCLQRLFRYAIESMRVYRGDNPAAAVPKVAVTKQDPKVLTREQLAALFSKVEADKRALFMFAAYTGLRKGEIAGLLKSKVDLERRCIVVDKSYDGPTKSKKPRTVPIPAELVPVLREQMEIPGKSPFVFPSGSGGMLSKDYDLADMTKRALARAGFVEGYEHVCRRQGCQRKPVRLATAKPFACPAPHPTKPDQRCGFTSWPKAIHMDLSFKSLRSTCGTLSYEATGDLRYVQDMLGHQDDAVTRGHYARLRAEHMVKQGDRLSLATHTERTTENLATGTDATANQNPERSRGVEGVRDIGFEPMAFGSGGRPAESADSSTERSTEGPAGSDDPPLTGRVARKGTESPRAAHNPRTTAADLREKLERFSEPEPNTGCTLWFGGVNGSGHAMMKVGGRGTMAYRVAYELEHGPIPAGLQIDHLCRVRCCVNPAHMEAVTSGENTLRGISPSAVNARKAECIRGHDLAGANLYVSPDGHRHCRICTAAAKRAHYERNQARIVANSAARRERQRARLAGVTP